MRIVRLQVEGFKRVVAVDITPEGDLVALGGDNGEGKSSVLDAILAALGGANAAPMKPIRTGEEYAIIKLDLGDLKVTRYFGPDGTERLKVENAEGFEAKSPQTVLNDIVGKIAFDPLSFAFLEPEKQAAELRRLVPLDVDLDEMALLNKADYDARRDVNRDGRALRARIDGIIIPSGDLGERPDREAIAKVLGEAADTNGAIERDKVARAAKDDEATAAEGWARKRRADAEELRRRAEEAAAEAVENDTKAASIRAELEAMPSVAAPVDTAKLREELATADRLAEIFRRRDEKAALAVEFEELKSRSESLTAAMAERDGAVEKALAEAAMPVPGLKLGRLPDPAKPDEPGELIVMFEGEPFSQSSTAAQIRVSARLAMAMNPKLRVMIVKQGAFLDSKGLALLGEIAAEGDFQIWLETVGERDGVGIIMEGGKVKGAPEPEKVEAPKRRKAKGEADDGDRQGLTVVDRTGDKPVTRPATDEEIALIMGEATKPERRKATAMREFTTPTPQGAAPKGDLFGGSE